uniref:Uncharacterized protein n=1 Tax=Aegilops tauschii subsp. strangulata TaxID=200361 RepID=A0A453J5P7_AEGTS
MANPLEVTSLGHVQSIVKGYDGIFDLPVRIISIDSLRDAEEIVALLYDKVSEEGGEWRIEEFPLLQRLDKLHDYVRSASTLLDEIDSAVENHDELMIRPQLLRNTGVHTLELDLSSLSACSFRTRQRPLPQRAVSLAHEICDLAELLVVEQDPRVLLGRVRSLGLRVGRFVLKKVHIAMPPPPAPVDGFVAPREMHPLNSFNCVTALVESHGNELGVHARLFCIDGIRNARKVFDLMRGRVQDRGWRVFNFQLLPQLAILHDNLVQARLECANIARSLGEGRSLDSSTGHRLCDIICTLRYHDLNSLATCCFHRDDVRLPEAVSDLALGALFYLAGEVDRQVHDRDLPNFAQTVARDIGLFLNWHLYLDANPGPG